MKFLILFVALFGTALLFSGGFYSEGLAFLFAGGPEEGECGCCADPCCCVCIDQLCSVTQEIALIVDASGSIGSDWMLVKEFLINLVNAFKKIGEDGTRVGFITFSTNATVWWRLDSKETSSRARLLEAIEAVPRTAKFTNTPEALQFANTDIFNAPGDKPEIPNIAIVLTDGRHTHGRYIFEQVAADLQDSATVFAIGVTDEISQDDLETIASGKGNKNTFRVTDFNALKDILNDLVEETCTEEPTTRAPTTPPKRECFCCCPPPPFGGIRPLNLCC